MAITSLGPEHR